MKLLTHFLPSKLGKQLIMAWCNIDESCSAEILRPSEKKMWNSFESDLRRNEYVATRWLFRELVQQLNLDPELFELKKDELGKPYGKYKGVFYHLSISHTNERVLVALSPNLAIGVDLEPVERKIPDELRSRILNNKEDGLLVDQETIRIWTVKEAMVKLQGKGMRTNLNECIILSIKNSYLTAKFNDNKRVRICSFKHNNNWLALAWNN